MEKKLQVILQFLISKTILIFLFKAGLFRLFYFICGMFQFVKKNTYSTLLIIFGSLFSCSENTQPQLLHIQPDDKVKISFRQFHQDLFELSHDSIDEKDIKQLTKSYPKFFPLFTSQIIRVGTSDHPGMPYYLNSFTHDFNILEIKHKTDSVFQNLSDFNLEINEAFKRFKPLCPGKNIPNEVIYFISAFNYAIVCDDSLLAIGLDMFLGPDATYYSIIFPKYMIQKMSKEYLVRDALYGWISTEYEPEFENPSILDFMLYYGKIFYALKNILPEKSDTILFKYSRQQLKWLEDNEPHMWKYFLEKNLLFSTENQEIAKYINDGPFTPGFPEGSPGRAAHWLGYKIVLSYVKHNKIENLNDLFNLTNGPEFLKQSNYRPDE